MKVAYILLLVNESVGVEKSLSIKAKECANIGVGIDFYLINPNIEEKKNGINYVQIKYNKNSIKYIYYFIFSKYRLIEKHVNLRQYDYIILRYQNADFSGIKFVKRYKVITEHHTDEVSEIKISIKLANKLSRKIFLYIRLIQELLFSSKLLQNNRGIIAVTDEIRKIELKKAGKEIPSITLTNAIKVESVKQTGFRPFNGKDLDMIFISNSNSPWHGLDRLIFSLDKYTGHVFVKLHIIGNIPNIFNNKKKNYEIFCYGKMNNQKLDEFMAGMNLAVSTLALYRKNMHEACALKTREYFARGIPFIYAYLDKDLEKFRDAKLFSLKLTNDDSIINFQDIIDFVKKFNSINGIKQSMRKFAISYIDIGIRVKDMIEFIHTIDKSNN